MSAIAIYLSKTQLEKAAGSAGYIDVMKSLVKEGVILSYNENIVEVILDKDKALHFQSILEFYDTRLPPEGLRKRSKKGSSED